MACALVNARDQAGRHARVRAHATPRSAERRLRLHVEAIVISLDARLSRGLCVVCVCVHVCVCMYFLCVCMCVWALFCVRVHVSVGLGLRLVATLATQEVHCQVNRVRDNYSWRAFS